MQFETRMQDAVHASQAVVIARGAGPESANTAPNPALMQDIARITAGRSLTLKTFAAAMRSPSALADAIPLSAGVPMEEHRIPLVPPYVLYLLLFASCMLAWWLRRSLSLK